MTAELVTRKQLAERLNVSPTAIAVWQRKGIVPVVRITATTIRYDFEAVIEALKKRSPHVERRKSPREKSRAET